MSAIPQALVESIYAGNCVLWLGAKIGAVVGVPGWTELLAEALDRCGLAEDGSLNGALEHGKHVQVLGHLEREHHGEALGQLLDEVEELGTEGQFVEGGDEFGSMPWRAVLASIYPGVAARALAAHKGDIEIIYPSVALGQLQSDLLSYAVVSMRPTAGRLASANTELALLRELLRTRDLLLVGFERHDPDFQQMLRLLEVVGGGGRRWAVLPEINALADGQLEDTVGLKVLPDDESGIGQWMHALVRSEVDGALVEEALATCQQAFELGCAVAELPSRFEFSLVAAQSRVMPSWLVRVESLDLQTGCPAFERLSSRCLIGAAALLAVHERWQDALVATQAASSKAASASEFAEAQWAQALVCRQLELDELSDAAVAASFDADPTLSPVPEALSVTRVVRWSLNEVVLECDSREEPGSPVHVSCVLFETSLTAERQRHFAARVQQWSEIEHAALAPILQYYTDARRAGLVGVLVPGPTLRQYLHLHGDVLPPAQAIAILSPVAQALETAHRRNLAHGVVGPDQLIVTAQGLILTGLVLMAVDITPQGLWGAAGSYLAPERRHGEPATLASDVYGLAATMLRVMVGTPPDGRVLTNADRGVLTPGVWQVLDRALDGNPAARPSVAAFWSELAAAVAHPAVLTVAAVDSVVQPPVAAPNDVVSGGAPEPVVVQASANGARNDEHAVAQTVAEVASETTPVQAAAPVDPLELIAEVLRSRSFDLDARKELDALETSMRSSERWDRLADILELRAEIEQSQQQRYAYLFELAKVFESELAAPREAMRVLAEAATCVPASAIEEFLGRLQYAAQATEDWRAWDQALAEVGSRADEATTQEQAFLARHQLAGGRLKDRALAKTLAAQLWKLGNRDIRILGDAAEQARDLGDEQRLEDVLHASLAAHLAQPELALSFSRQLVDMYRKRSDAGEQLAEAMLQQSKLAPSDAELFGEAIDCCIENQATALAVSAVLDRLTDSAHQPVTTRTLVAVFDAALASEDWPHAHVLLSALVEVDSDAAQEAAARSASALQARESEASDLARLTLDLLRGNLESLAGVQRSERLVLCAKVALGLNESTLALTWLEMAVEEAQAGADKAAAVDRLRAHHAAVGNWGLWQAVGEHFVEDTEMPARARVSWLVELCKYYQEHEQLDAALTSATKWQELAPTDVAALRTMVELQTQAGDRAGAIEAMRTQFDLDLPAQTRIELATALASELMQDDPAAALEFGQRAVDLAPEASSHWSLLQQIYERLDKHEEALSAEENAARCMEEGAVKARALHEVSQKMDAWPTRRKLLREALEASAADAGVLTDLVEGALEHGDVEQAWELAPDLVAAVRTANSEDRLLAKALRLAGHAALAASQDDRAREYLKEAVELAPQDVDSQLLQARLELARSGWSQALVGLRKRLNHASAAELAKTELAQIHFEIATCLSQLGQTQACLESLGQALRSNPNHEGALRRRLELLEVDGVPVDIAKARTALATALETGLENATDSQELRSKRVQEVAWLLAEAAGLMIDPLGRPAEAVSLLERALVHLPGDAGLLHRMLDACTAAESWENAVSALGHLADQQTSSELEVKYCYAAAAIARDHLEDRDVAAAWMQRTLKIQPLHEKAFSGLVAIYHQQQSWQAIADTIATRIQALPENARLEKMGLYEQVASICEKQLHDPAAALTAYEQGIAFAPPSLDVDVKAHRRKKVMTLSLRALGDEGLPRAISHGLALLTINPLDLANYRQVLELCQRAGRHEQAAAIARVLRFLKKATPSELKIAGPLVSELPVAKAVLSREQWRRYLCHPEENMAIAELLGLIWPVLAARAGRTHANVGVDRRARMSATMSTPGCPGAIAQACQTLDLALPDLFTSEGNDAIVVTALSDRKNVYPTMLIGDAVMREPMGSRLAFRVARALTRARPESVSVRILPSAGSLRDAINGAILLAGGELDLSDQTREFAAVYSREIQRLLPPARIESLRGAVERVQASDSIDTQEFVRGTEFTAVRAGYLLSGSLEECANALVQTRDEVGVVSAQDLVRDLIGFSVSDGYFKLREALGMSQSGQDDLAELLLENRRPSLPPPLRT